MMKAIDFSPLNPNGSKFQQLRIAGLDLGKLARQYGGPLYLYDAADVCGHHRR
ncbi:MAG TPA: hypothetical protein VF326_13380 [Anaerolineaceae bacterium]